MRRRIAKATRVWKVISHLGNSNGGMSPQSHRALYTGAIRTIFTWGAELYNRPGIKPELTAMNHMEYQALRKITGAYHGSSHQKLGWIANIEPLHDKLDDISRCWAARSLRTGDPLIRTFLDVPTATCADPPTPVPKISPWHDSTTPDLPRDSPISEVFYLTGIQPEERSYGDREDTTTFALSNLTIYDPGEERSKTAIYWKLGIDSLAEEGWRTAFTDGTGREGKAAAWVHCEDKFRDDSTYGAYAGTT